MTSVETQKAVSNEVQAVAVESMGTCHVGSPSVPKVWIRNGSWVPEWEAVESL